jgi:serine/threonine-protein kinase HipA
MSDVEVHLERGGVTEAVGRLRRYSGRGHESVTFEYDGAWLSSPETFSLEPALALTRGTFTPDRGKPMFGSLGDSAPDT